MSPDNGTREVEGSELAGSGGSGGPGDLESGDLESGDLGSGDLESGDLDDVEGFADDELDGQEPDDLEAVTEDELVVEEVERLAARAPRGPRRAGPFRRLYRGETSFDFVGRRRWWFTISTVIILAGILSLGVRGLNLGITFKGGTAWSVTAPGVTQAQALTAVQSAGLSQPTVEIIGTGSAETVRVTADLNSLNASARAAVTAKVRGVLARLGKVGKTTVSETTVGPTWGGQVTQKAVIALVVFLVLVAVYISIRFEPKMAIAAFVALLHDLLITAGVYSLAGFQVTPDTVIAVLTILGYSLYDTVVVFDRVRDNTKGLGATGRMTYSEMVNLSMNQTLARSINTSLVAILPVLSVLLIGAELLGATTLQNYGLALFVGLCSGAYSSIFIASPILAWLKEREPRYVAMRQRIEAKGERLGLLTPRAAAAMLATAGGGGGAARASRDGRGGAIRPGQARTTRRAAPPSRGTATATLEPGAAAPAGNGGTPAGNGGTPAGNGGSPAAGPRTGRPQQRQSAARRPASRSRKGGKGKRRR
jgi:preprotein translocase subunit SecF